MSGTVQLPPDSTGKKVDTSELTVSAQTVERQRIVLASPTDAAGLADANAKGTQGTYGLQVQDFKDSGRTAITLFANAVVGIVAETMLTITQVKAGVAQGAATNYSVTAGKTFRITSFTVTGTTTGAAANNIRGTMRYTTSGTVATTSGTIITAQAVAMSATSGTALVPVSIPISDGYEIPAAASYGVSQTANVTTTTISVMVTGFEY